MQKLFKKENLKIE